MRRLVKKVAVVIEIVRVVATCCRQRETVLLVCSGQRDHHSVVADLSAAVQIHRTCSQLAFAAAVGYQTNLSATIVPAIDFVLSCLRIDLLQ